MLPTRLFLLRLAVLLASSRSITDFRGMTAPLVTENRLTHSHTLAGAVFRTADPLLTNETLRCNDSSVRYIIRAVGVSIARARTRQAPSSHLRAAPLPAGRACSALSTQNRPKVPPGATMASQLPWQLNFSCNQLAIPVHVDGPDNPSTNWGRWAAPEPSEYPPMLCQLFCIGCPCPLRAEAPSLAPGSGATILLLHVPKTMVAATHGCPAGNS